MRYLIAIVLLGSTILTSAQKKIINSINQSITAREAEAHLTFLAADEMRGRNTGSPEIDIAANYLVSQFKIQGVKPYTGSTDYFQPVLLERIITPTAAELVIGTAVLKLKDDILMLSGGTVSLEKELVFVGYGTDEDFKKQDVKGKIVVALAGTPQTKNAVEALLTDGPVKNTRAQAYGASALVEIMTLPGIPWQGLVNFVSANRMSVRSEQVFAHVLMKNTDNESVKALMETKRSNGKLELTAVNPIPVNAKNVIGMIEGTDAKLKNEWIAVTAHYDHVGVKKTNNPDSIFNGARDNAIGTVALLEAAAFFKLNPPKRSVLLVGLTGEEMGLLGSAWYSNHPVVPLSQTIFDFNCDGAGYNDTSFASIIDFNRTTADDMLRKACAAFGLGLKGDPAPEQNLYERSDNVNFATKGIPAVNFSPGVKAFDADLFKYYHKPADEVGSLDMAYLEKFYRAFVYSTYLLANTAERPVWKAGDKFEAAGKALYGQ